MDGLMIACIEELSMRAWPAYEAQIYDGWILRFAAGYTKRANCINPLYASSIDLAQKISYCEKIYGDHGLPAVFKLNQESTPPGLDRELEARGYDRLDETSVRVLPLGDRRAADRGMQYYPHVCEEWIQAFARCSGIDDANMVEKLAPNPPSHPGERPFLRMSEREIASWPAASAYWDKAIWGASIS